MASEEGHMEVRLICEVDDEQPARTVFLFDILADGDDELPAALNLFSALAERHIRTIADERKAGNDSR